MDAKAAIGDRRSIRRFSSQPVPDSALAELLEAATRAPSNGNRQPWRFVVATGELKRTLIREMEARAATVARGGMRTEGLLTSTSALASAPVALLVFNTEFPPVPGASPVYEAQRLAAIQSIGAAIENLMLRACDLGLGSLWVGWVLAIEEEIKRILGRSDELVAGVALGYPAESPPPRPRKRLEEVVEWR